MVVQHNISAMNANRYYTMNNSALGKSLEKLSSGYAINRAGDNAAGLAVSEKMRAQISGMTQASKNAQDGISMVQTFEGALQETDSILQRMRTLAVQSANGSYANEVDREAIQLEFDQLNDELNQIADTDFNGVVMLNGGTMADGLDAVDGKFDYANKADQLTAKATAAAQEAVDTAKTAMEAAQKTFDETNYDLSKSGEANEWNTVDQNKITKTDLNNLWGSLGLTTDGTVDETGAKADTSDVTEIAVTFTYKVTDGVGTWEATKGLANGEETTSLDETQLEALTDMVTVAADATTEGVDATDTATGYGGFSVKMGSADGTTTTANAVFNAHDAKDGDTVTLVFSNSKPATYAPTNAGFDENSLTIKNNNATGKDAYDITSADLTFTKGALTDDNISEKAVKAYEALEDATFSVDYSQENAGKTSGAAGTYGNVKLTLADGTECEIDMTTDEAQEFVAADGTKFTVKSDKDDEASAAVLTFASEDNKTLFTIGIGAAGGKSNSPDEDDKVGKDGTISAKISISASNYDSDKGFGVTVGSDDDLKTSSANKEALDAAKAAYSKAQEDLANIKDLDSAKAYLNKGSVAESDTYNQSRAKMTYSDKMSLQTGARTKDIVNFTFSYQSEGLGDLKADLDASARGLGTDRLSLASQKDANNAIDKIDNALNKISMIRGTFGAVQNRLEHKINNLDTNVENLTAAESRIRDTQMDQEMMKFTSAQILAQASQSMLAQANSLPQGVLQLLG